MASVIPVFFGISQCLIVVRVAISKELAQSRGSSQSRSRAVASSAMPSLVLPNDLGTTQDKYASDYSSAEEHTLDVMSRNSGVIGGAL